jgi:phage baseplate assembly protein W
MADANFQNVREYKDISLSMGLNPVTNDIITLTGAAAVVRSIKTLMQTYAGEVPFFPDFASRLRELLFEPIDSITTSLIETELQTILDAYEPRATIQTITVTPDPDNNQYLVLLEIQIVNTAEDVTFSLYLKRLR